MTAPPTTRFPGGRALATVAITLALAIPAGSTATAAPAPTPAKAATPTTAATTPPPTATMPTAPRRVDAETAVSPVYPITAKACRNRDDYGSEGEDFLRRCPGYGGYALRASGFDYRVNYGIESTARNQDFSVMLFPLEDGPAGKYARADLFDEKLEGPIEWQLDPRGKPFAVIARAAFYRNTGSPKTFRTPANRKATFLLVRGLAGYEALQADIPTADTAYNPVEQARMVARTFLEKRQP